MYTLLELEQWAGNKALIDFVDDLFDTKRSSIDKVIAPVSNATQYNRASN